MQLKYGGRHVFRTGQRLILGTKPKTKTKKEDTMNNAAIDIMNQLAKGILARDKEAEDQERQLAQLHPDPPPACLLAPTETAKLVEEHYQKPGTIKTNVNGVKGMESYAPPPILLAPIEPKEAK